jgi:hypothetical protein
VGPTWQSLNVRRRYHEGAHAPFLRSSRDKDNVGVLHPLKVLKKHNLRMTSKHGLWTGTFGLRLKAYMMRRA